MVIGVSHRWLFRQVFSFLHFGNEDRVCIVIDKVNDLALNIPCHAFIDIRLAGGRQAVRHFGKFVSVFAAAKSENTKRTLFCVFG